MRKEDNTFERAIERLSNDLQSFIDYCEATTADQWYLHKVRNEDNTNNCLYGHLVNWYYGKDYVGNISPMWDAFEEVGSSYYVYEINDGNNPTYQQATARDRCIAYLKNVESGKELWTAEAMERESKKYAALVKAP